MIILLWLPKRHLFYKRGQDFICRNLLNKSKGARFSTTKSVIE